MQELCKRRQAAWIAKLRREYVKPGWYKNTRICSDHFVSGAPSPLYDETNEDWVPTLNLGWEDVVPESTGNTIIDCFEIFLDSPTNLLARAQT